MNILIIDDDEDDRTLFTDALAEMFPDVICTSLESCENMRQTLDQVQPHVIFVDGHMYPKSGVECFKEIKSILGPTAIQIVVHSGSLNPDELREFKNAGATDIIIKATTFTALKDNIRNILEKPELNHLLQGRKPIRR